MNNNYSSKYEVASDIVRYWQEFAVENLFDIMSFNSDFEIDTFQLSSNNNTNMILSRVDNKINVIINIYEFNHEAYDAAMALRDADFRANRGRPLMYRGFVGNNEGYVQIEIVNCELKNLKKQINKENSKYFIDLAILFLNEYNNQLEQKNVITNLVNSTKILSQQLVSKEFLVEKL